MARLDPESLRQRVTLALKKTADNASLRTPKRAVVAKREERERIWNVLMIAALNGETFASFTSLNVRESRFIEDLGIGTVKTNSDSTENLFSRSQLDFLEGNLSALESRLAHYQSDVFGPHEADIRICREEIGRYRQELARLVGGTVFDKYKFDLRRIDTLKPVSAEYDVRWLRWARSDQGQVVMRLFERQMELLADMGDRFLILTVKNLRQGRIEELIFLEDMPWEHHNYYVGDAPLFSHGPHPDVFRYFLELLEYKVSMKLGRSSASIRVQW